MHRGFASAENIAEARLWLISKRFGKKKEDDLTIEQLIDQPAVHFEEGVELRSYIEGQLKKLLKVSLAVPSMEAVLQYIYQGVGYSILPEFVISPYWRRKLLARDITERIAPLKILLYRAKKRVLPRAAELFSQQIRK